jgi:hypothetical protein
MRRHWGIEVRSGPQIAILELTKLIATPEIVDDTVRPPNLQPHIFKTTSGYKNFNPALELRSSLTFRFGLRVKMAVTCLQAS